MNRTAAVLVLIMAVQLLACQIAYLFPSSTPTPTRTRTRTPTRAALPPTVPPPVVAPPTVAPAVVNATATENLRVRANPSTSGTIIGRLNKGDTAQIVGRTAASDWWQILLPSDPDTRGWVSAEFTTTDGPTDAVPVTEPGAPAGGATPAAPPVAPVIPPPPVNPYP